MAAIVERISGGDAFAAGLIHAWLMGGNDQVQLDAGLAYMVVKHAIPGEFCIVTRTELERFLSGRGGDLLH